MLEASQLHLIPEEVSEDLEVSRLLCRHGLLHESAQ